MLSVPMCKFPPWTFSRIVEIEWPNDSFEKTFCQVLTAIGTKGESEREERSLEWCRMKVKLENVSNLDRHRRILTRRFLHLHLHLLLVEQQLRIIPNKN